jgi:hypothetical protein
MKGPKKTVTTTTRPETSMNIDERPEDDDKEA